MERFHSEQLRSRVYVCGKLQILITDRQWPRVLLVDRVRKVPWGASVRGSWDGERKRSLLSVPHAITAVAFTGMSLRMDKGQPFLCV